MSHYIKYYDEQVGGGGVGSVYVGARYQRGHGIGSWLGGLFRKVLPYVASGAKAVGKEAARAGLNVLGDVAGSGVDFKESVKTRAHESRKNLQRKAAAKIAQMMEGSGYKRKTKRRKAQSKKKHKSVRTARKKASRKKKTVTKKRKKKAGVRDITDIFGPK